MTTKSFAVFDADSHVVETPVLWEKYLDPEYHALGKHALWRQEGRTGAYLKINGEIFRDTGNPNLPRHALWRPGMTWDAIGELDPRARHPMTEGASDPQARLADMDAMGVDQTLLYPTWFAEGFFLVRDPDVAYALSRAYNDWVADFCKAAPQRLFAAAVLPLQNMDFAVDELQRVARIPCFRAVFIRPTFVENRYLNHTYYEPLWAEIEWLDITAAVHATRVCGTRNGPRMAHFLRRSRIGWRGRRSPAVAAGRLPGVQPRATPPSAGRHPSTIHWRRSSPPGSTTHVRRH